MNTRSLFLTIIFAILLLPVASSQIPDETVLFTISGHETSAGEFTRMYSKSKNTEDNSGLDEYLDLFVTFKLKVTDALENRYDTAASFINELNGYREQLAQNYLADNEIREKLVRDAYSRSLTEINASHILIRCQADASPEDTLKAFKQALEIRNKIIITGEQFEEVAKLFSDDRSSVSNGGNLGYFTVFRMIKPFEDAAYSMKPGELSMPVRTYYGYHIIKINDIRPSRGKIKAAHIMKSVPPGADDSIRAEAELEINRLYNLLKQGSSFRELASNYSDHKQSAAKGGELEWFGTGDMVPEFSEAAFALTDSGDYTKPVRSPYGYHIIMLTGKRPAASFMESRSYLESRINPSYINELSRKSVVERLKSEYGFKICKNAADWFIKNTDTLIMRGITIYNPEEIPDHKLYTFADQHLMGKDFASIIHAKSSPSLTGNPGNFIRREIERISEDHIIRFENSILESKYPDFKYLMKEFHDGILLFNISSDKVWNRSLNDTAGLRIHYERNIPKFGADFDEVRGDVIADYQEWLMQKWLQELKNKYSVKIDSQVFGELKNILANE